MNHLDQLAGSLSERDFGILHDLEAFRLLTTRHIQRLHFDDKEHQTMSAATRACTRVMARLKAHGLVSTLRRRIGGVRQGSAGLTWQLAATGDSLLRSLRGDPKRRRYSEPSLLFVDHTLLVAELAVKARETAREWPDWNILHLSAERHAWQPFVGPHGAKEWLKPDLHLITTDPNYEQHWFIEADRGHEHAPQLLRKLQTYQRFARTGRYQSKHDLFPTVLWVVLSHKRIQELEALINEGQLPRSLFHLSIVDGFIDAITNFQEPESVPLPGIFVDREAAGSHIERRTQ